MILNLLIDRIRSCPVWSHLIKIANEDSLLEVYVYVYVCTYFASVYFRKIPQSRLTRA